uniref:NADP-dependent oxidoreductase domain-containing protein n=1 Tax=Candidozyma auris TaxID=498019 RepID=A0A0L0NZ64_CANAR
MSVQLPGKFAYGTMSMTWTPEPISHEQAFECLLHVIEKHGVNFIVGGEFYGPDDANMKMTEEFWKKYGDKYPDLIVSLKAGFNLEKFCPDGSQESVAKSIKQFASHFPKEKSKRPKLIFEVARVDPTISYDKTIGYISEFVKQGVIDGISISEVGAGSIQKAISVAPISAIEVEFHLLCEDILTNGVLAEAAKHDIPVIAYSPLCRGFLTEFAINDLDNFYKLSNRPGDVRANCDKFVGDNFWHNAKRVKALQEFAHKKGTTLESLSLSWIIAVGGQENFFGIPKLPKIMPITSGTSALKIDRNLGSPVQLTRADLEEINKINEAHPVKGYRYTKEAEALSFA